MVLLFAAVRVGLLIFNGDWSVVMPRTLIRIFALGLAYDLSVALWWAMPLALLYLVWPRRRALVALRAVSLAMTLIAFGVLGFVAVAEFVFWNEFVSRFNFIAVDYLIYSREVIGNIRESYQLPWLLALAAALGLLASLLNLSAQRPLARTQAHAIKGRALRFLALLGGAALLTTVVDTRWKEGLGSPQATHLSGNGPWEFFHAFRYNEIDYQEYYRTVTPERANELMRAQ